MEDNKVIYIIVGIIAVILFAVIVFAVLTDGNNTDGEEDNVVENETSNTADEEETEIYADEEYDYEAAAEEQMADAESGETIAIIHVKDFGDITVKFFDDVAPKAVENFVTHAQEGYYDGVTFHRVMEDFMIQGGDPEGTGAGGESIWGEGFEEEIDKSLVPYRGALCMASLGYGTSSLGSQFFIVQADYDEDQTSSLLLNGYAQSLVDAYSEYGGYLSLYGSYTVFGQVIEGMDVVDKIATVEKNYSSSGELSDPVEDVIIETIEVTTKE